ncbi:BACON domain-containing protein [Mariniphaga sediminis]|uniref:BACON domain-containing protein n=1 Tax=Mariniphaga sediminis TaxID=1628158 RepID=UPI0035680540
MTKTNIKYLYRIFPLFLLIAFAGCKEEIDLESFTPDEPTMTITSGEIEVSNEEESFEIDIESNLPWRAEADVNWISLETKSALGDARLVFAVARNTTLEERQGTIRVWITKEYDKEIVVTQAPGEPTDVTVHWYVKEGATGDGSSWENATSLSNALQKVENDGDVIHIAEGTYAPVNTIRNGEESDPGDVTFEISRNITLIGGYSSNPAEGEEPDAATYKSVLSGSLESGGFAYHVVTVTALKSELNKVVLKGLTITEGLASPDASDVSVDGTTFPRNHGGGIIIGGANVDLMDCKISENSSGRHAAGMYVFASASVYMEGCEVSSNIGINSNSNAGGMFLDNATAVIHNTRFTFNNAGGVCAGIMTLNSANITLYNSIIANNTSRTHGCGFYNRTNSKALLVNCLIADNTNNTGNGGGFAAHNGTTTDIISSTIVGNSANAGGGMYIYSGNTVNLYNSIVAQNSPAEEQIVLAGTLMQKKSIIGTAVFDGDQNQIPDVVFNADAMLEDKGNFVIVPVGEGNPATIYGMSSPELGILGNSVSPQVEDEIITFDLLGNSRENKNTMGAFIHTN